MPETGRRMLMFGAVLVACVSLFHVVCAIVGPSAYRQLGAGEAMASKAASGSPWPAIFTLSLAAVFGLSALYALSAAGRLRPLPLARTVVIGIGVIFGIRGLLVVFDVVALLHDADVIAVRNLFYSLVALLVGVLYVLGLALSRRPSARAEVHP